MKDRSLFSLNVLLRVLRRQPRDLGPGLRKVMPAYVEMLSGAGVASTLALICLTFLDPIYFKQIGFYCLK